MNDQNSLFPTFLLILEIIAIVGGLIFITKVIKKYRHYVFKMQKNETYTVWARENKLLLLFAKLFDYAAGLCAIGFGFFLMAKIPSNARFLFELLVAFKFISIASYLVLYLRIPKNQNDVV
jgi:hypothetical protein